MSDDALIQEWLSECRTESTRIAYKFYIGKFKQWYQKPLSTFIKLEPKDMRHIALQYQNTSIAKQMNPNTVCAILTALGSFCTFNDKTLRLRGKRVRKVIDLSSHVFTNQDLKRMFDVADLQEKALIATMASLGWEISAILALERVKIQALTLKAQEDRKQFVYFIDQRKKTGVIRLGVLNPLALEWLTEWFKTPVETISQEWKRYKGVTWDPKRLFGYGTKEGVNAMLKRLARTANVTVTGRVHSHLIRKWVMSGLSRAGFNEFQIKFVMGKAIPLEDFTYLQTLQQEVEARYPKAYKDQLNFTGQQQQFSDEQIALMNQILEKAKEGKLGKLE